MRAALAAEPLTHRWRLVPASVNGQLASGCYRFFEDRGRFVGEGVNVLTLRNGRIAAITSFLVPDLSLYGLPPEISS